MGTQTQASFPTSPRSHPSPDARRCRLELDHLPEKPRPLLQGRPLPVGRGDPVTSLPLPTTCTRPVPQRDTEPRLCALEPGSRPTHLLAVIGQGEAVDAEAREDLLLLLQREWLGQAVQK